MLRYILTPNCFRSKRTRMREESSLPAKDELVLFLLQSSTDSFPKCSNCDRNEKAQIFFCNTCGEGIINYLVSNRCMI